MIAVAPSTDGLATGAGHTPPERHGGSRDRVQAV